MRRQYKKGFSLVEVLVAAAILVSVCSIFMSILFQQHSRVIGGDVEAKLFDLANSKLLELVDLGYPPEALDATPWEPFLSVAVENKELHMDFRWRYYVVDFEEPEWIEDAYLDKELREKAGITDPYRLLTVEVQQFTVEGAENAENPVGLAMLLTRLMKPAKAETAEPETTTPTAAW